MTMAEATHYISHRVQTTRVEGIDFPVFADRAMELLSRSAGFVPRVINILADKALLVAYGEGAIQVTDKHVETAIDDSPQLAQPVRMARGWVRRALIGLIVAEVAAVIALFVFSPDMRNWAMEILNSARSAMFGA